MGTDTGARTPRGFPAGAAGWHEALELFDSLPGVEPQAMLGSWRGRTFPSGHPLDGVLEAYHWWGKRFDSVEHVHPLVFRTRAGTLVPLRARWLLPGLALLDRIPAMKSDAAGRAARWLLPLAATQHSQGRLRSLQHRGRVSACLVYDGIPVIDVFRQAGDDRLLGLMDLKGMARPFFFMLERRPAA